MNRSPLGSFRLACHGPAVCFASLMLHAPLLRYPLHSVPDSKLPCNPAVVLPRFRLFVDVHLRFLQADKRPQGFPFPITALDCCPIWHSPALPTQMIPAPDPACSNTTARLPHPAR